VFTSYVSAKAAGGQQVRRHVDQLGPAAVPALQRGVVHPSDVSGDVDVLTTSMFSGLTCSPYRR
jgi:hypothetical protein